MSARIARLAASAAGLKNERDAILKERQARMERQLTPVSVKDLKMFLREVDQAVVQFVVPELRSAFYAACASQTSPAGRLMERPRTLQKLRRS